MEVVKPEDGHSGLFLDLPMLCARASASYAVRAPTPVRDMVDAMLIPFLLRWLAGIPQDFALCGFFFLDVHTLFNFPEWVSIVWPHGSFQGLKIFISKELIVCPFFWRALKVFKLIICHPFW